MDAGARPSVAAVPSREHRRAAREIAAADALLITAGAGMGVDSGMPDFRGTEGFWRAYPAYAQAGLSFERLATPRWFKRDPALAWGFYGARMRLYRDTTPHAGFGLLRSWTAAKSMGAFVFTSNVDGHFQRAGFPETRVVEPHGALRRLQCTAECGAEPWSARGVRVEVDPTTLRVVGVLPCCPECGAVARPNVLMFDDTAWNSEGSDMQQARLDRWLSRVSAASARLVVVELGAGTAVPTVRAQGESVAAATGAVMVRINLREHRVPNGHVGIAGGALVSLFAIDDCMKGA